jgi:hypothetical protein
VNFPAVVYSEWVFGVSVITVAVVAVVGDRRAAAKRRHRAGLMAEPAE